MEKGQQKRFTSWGKILVVDDVATTREFTRAALESNGFYECLEAAGGREALSILANTEVDLVLLDLLMPDMSGFDVLKEIRRRYTDTQLPVIVITALEDTIDIVTALELGATDYVVKPFEFPVLHARVRAPLARRNAEQKLFAALNRLEAADEAKSHMFSRMSHELRTPLNAIIGFTELLGTQNTENLTDEQKEFIGYVFNAGSDLLSLIDDIMTLSALDNDQLTLHMRRCDPKQVISDAVGMIDTLAQSKSVTIAADLDLQGSPSIYSDPIRFKQVMVGLLSNAVKFNRPGGSVTIAMEVRDDQFLRISVRDTGVGISADQSSRIFEPMQRFGPDRATMEGTGMGLTVAHRLVKHMGGSIDFRSEFGVGSCFWVELPLAMDKGALMEVTDGEASPDRPTMKGPVR